MISKKGMQNYIVWLIVLLIIVIIALTLFYSIGIKLIEEIVKKKIFG